MDVVTHKTALALKEAGFPQPIPAIGQFWYLEDRISVVYDDLGELAIVELQDGNTWTTQVEDLAFAPTPTDLLRELGGKYSLHFFKKNSIPGVFFPDSRFEVKHENGMSSDKQAASEILAKAYLQEHKQPA